MDRIQEFLEHYGVRGMHWGIRNRHSKVKKLTSSEHKKARELKRRGVSSLTNQQLKILNERLNLEQNFNRMNPGKRKKGEAHLKAFLATASLATSAIGVLNTPAGKAAISVGKTHLSGKKYSDKEARALVMLSKNLHKTL